MITTTKPAKPEEPITSPRAQFPAFCHFPPHTHPAPSAGPGQGGWGRPRSPRVAARPPSHRAPLPASPRPLAPPRLRGGFKPPASRWGEGRRTRPGGPAGCIYTRGRPERQNGLWPRRGSAVRELAPAAWGSWGASARHGAAPASGGCCGPRGEECPQIGNLRVCEAARFQNSRFCFFFFSFSLFLPRSV